MKLAASILTGLKSLQPDACPPQHRLPLTVGVMLKPKPAPHSKNAFTKNLPNIKDQCRSWRHKPYSKKRAKES
jgi:hypothetical protein